MKKWSIFTGVYRSYCRLGSQFMSKHKPVLPKMNVCIALDKYCDIRCIRSNIIVGCTHDTVPYQ